MMHHDENFCAEIQSTLPLFVGGDLEAQALAEVRRHLLDCPRCAERALAARNARRELVGALRLAARPGPDLWGGVRAALVEEGVLRPVAPLAAAARAARPWWSSWTFLAAAAAAVVVGIAIGSGWTGGHAAPRGGEAQPIAFQPKSSSPSIPVSFVGESDVGPSQPVPDLAQAPAEEVGGLRRLKPGEHALRDSVPQVPIDRAFLYGAGGPFGTGGRNRDAMQPVSLHRVGPNAPRW